MVATSLRSRGGGKGQSGKNETLESWTIRNLNQDVVTLVLLAWKYGVPSATMGVVDRADSVGLDMRATDNMAGSTRLRITYSKACPTKEAVKQELIRLRDCAGKPKIKWSNPLTWLVFLMWSIVIAAWLHKHDVHVLEKRLAKLIGLHKEDIPPSREFLAYITLTIFGTNLIEALAVAYMIRKKLYFSKRNTWLWFTLTFFMGYPIAQRCVELKQAQSLSYKRAYTQNARDMVNTGTIPQPKKTDED